MSQFSDLADDFPVKSVGSGLEAIGPPDAEGVFQLRKLQAVEMPGIHVVAQDYEFRIFIACFIIIQVSMSIAPSHCHSLAYSPSLGLFPR